MKHYSISCIPEDEGMDFLRKSFPDGNADNLNFVLFSTSGVHGHYCTIEEVEKGLDEFPDAVTFVVIRPRIIEMIYGNCKPVTKDDFDFLKKLRASSHAAVVTIGIYEHENA